MGCSGKWKRGPKPAVCPGKWTIHLGVAQKEPGGANRRFWEPCFHLPIRVPCWNSGFWSHSQMGPARTFRNPAQEEEESAFAGVAFPLATDLKGWGARGVRPNALLLRRGAGGTNPLRNCMQSSFLDMHKCFAWDACCHCVFCYLRQASVHVMAEEPAELFGRM